MFKRIQKYLLINQPMIWNIKLVPMICFLSFVHIVFYIIGYVNGELDFNETERHYNDNDIGIMFFFSILIAILTLILWLVYYFKNNGFKSFYPRNNLSLFKEWSALLLISFFLCSMHISYLSGYDNRIKGYYSEEEAKKKCELIQKASIFYGDNYDSPESKDSIVNDTLRNVALDYVLFDGKKYDLESLINKDDESFTFYDEKHDSLVKREVKHWILQGKTDSIKGVMKDYFKLLEQHHLKGNITQEQWFTLVYNPPLFINKRIIAKREWDLYRDNYDEYNETPSVKEKIDTVNQYLKIVNKQELLFNKTYLPADELEYNFNKISKTYTSPSVSSEVTLATIYFALGLSILLFSFRVTSGKSWLITLISVGVYNVLLGITTAISNNEWVYFVGLIVLILFIAIYFAVVLIRKTKKGISAIILNALLWVTPAFIPIIYGMITAILTLRYYRSNSYYVYRDEMDPTLEWFRNNAEAMGWFNLLFVLLVMLLLSSRIKKWKGIAES